MKSHPRYLCAPAPGGWCLQKIQALNCGLFKPAAFADPGSELRDRHRTCSMLSRSRIVTQPSFRYRNPPSRRTVCQLHPAGGTAFRWTVPHHTLQGTPCRDLRKFHWPELTAFGQRQHSCLVWCQTRLRRSTSRVSVSEIFSSSSAWLMTARIRRSTPTDGSMTYGRYFRLFPDQSTPGSVSSDSCAPSDQRSVRSAMPRVHPKANGISKIKLDVAGSVGIVGKFFRVMSPQAQLGRCQPQILQELHTGFAVIVKPLQVRSGLQKNSSSICSNSRVRKMKLPGVISFRNDLPIWPMPNGSFLRMARWTLRKIHEDALGSFRTQIDLVFRIFRYSWNVLNIRLKLTDRVKSLAPHPGQAISCSRI